MTQRKHLKTRVRARMTDTGERYAAARAHVVRSHPSDRPMPTDRGTNPAANALRRIVADIGLDLDEPLALLIGGGAGIGVFQFHYPKEGFSSLFLAGRHAWDDDLSFIEGALRRLELQAVVAETGSARAADRHLRDALDGGGPVIAWVDAAELGTRGYPPEFMGGAYHVVVVRSLDDARGVALLDDLAEGPVEVPIESLARARARIAKFRNRLVQLPRDTRRPEDAVANSAIRAGIDAMIDGFERPRTANFGLQALTTWAGRLRGSGKDAWPTVFPRGPRLLAGLASIHEHVEHYGGGGGLLRPMVAEALEHAADRLGEPALTEPAARYRELGAAWTNLARSALPDGVPELRRIRELQDRRASLYAERGVRALQDIAASWTESASIREAAAGAFSLDEVATRALLEQLAGQVDALHDAEVAAVEALRTAR